MADLPTSWGHDSAHPPPAAILFAQRSSYEEDPDRGAYHVPLFRHRADPRSDLGSDHDAALSPPDREARAGRQIVETVRVHLSARGMTDDAPGHDRGC